MLMWRKMRDFLVCQSLSMPDGLKAHLKRDQAESALTEPKPTVDVDKQATLHGSAEEGELSKDECI